MDHACKRAFQILSILNEIFFKVNKLQSNKRKKNYQTFDLSRKYIARILFQY